MTGPLYLSRARFRRDAPLKALAPLLLDTAGSGGPAGQPGHHLVWSLFADGANRRRDFLWREMQTGVFLILSARRPADPHGLFEIAEPKAFGPVLAAGDLTGLFASRQSRGAASGSVAQAFHQARCRDGRAACSSGW